MSAHSKHIWQGSDAEIAVAEINISKQLTASPSELVCCGSAADPLGSPDHDVRQSWCESQLWYQASSAPRSTATFLTKSWQYQRIGFESLDCYIIVQWQEREKANRERYGNNGFFANFTCLHEQRHKLLISSYQLKSCSFLQLVLYFLRWTQFIDTTDYAEAWWTRSDWKLSTMFNHIFVTNIWSAV